MESAELFLNLLLMAASDGRMSEAELRMLSDRATELGVTDDQFEQAIEDALSGRASLTLPPETQDRLAVLKDLIRMMAADGRIANEERQLFAVASSVLNIHPDALNRLIDEVLAEDS